MAANFSRHGARRQSWRQRAQTLLQRYLEAIGQKGHEDVRLDTPIALKTTLPTMG